MRRTVGWRPHALILGTIACVAGLLPDLYPREALGAGPRARVARPSRSAAPKSDYLDAMIEEAWEEASIKPSRPASDEEFLRRAYLDLLGRIPDIQEATAFLRSREPDRRGKLVKHLLDHPDYAKNFSTYWTVTLIGRKAQDRMVDRAALSAWLRRQFTDNRPWNELAYDLITAKGSNKENGAVNFPLAHLDFGAVPLTSITTRVFLGQQIQCTQCHDHPSNDWKQADFWGINAFFKGLRPEQVRTTDATGAEVYDHTELTDRPTNAYASFDKRNGLVGIAFPTFLDGRKVGQGPDVERRVELAKFITDPSEDDLARAIVNRMWGHFLGRGFVNPLDDFGPHNPPSHPELLDRLAAEFKASGYDLKALCARIMASRAYNLSSVMNPSNEKDDALFSHMALKPMSPEQLFESLLVATSAHKAGGTRDTDRRRDAWLRQFVFAFSNDEGEESSSFQGTIPQALMMMNGELMEKAVGGQKGSFLADLLERAMQSQRGSPEAMMVNQLYLAALSRAPSAREMAMAREFLSSYPDTIQVLQDVFWALLNSNEFVLIR